MCQRQCPRPSQRVTAIAITVQSAMPRLRSVGDRRPGLSQGAGSNSGAHQASPNRAVTRSYLTWNLQRHGVSIEPIRRDRVLHEALTARADPLHLALVFGLSHTPAGTRSSPAICWLTRPARTQMPQAGS
jgi:hypothetical protein